MLSASTLSFTGPAYSQNFDGLPNTGVNESAIATFGSSGPFDAISPTDGTTVDTGNDPQGLGATGMDGWSIAEYAGNALKDFTDSGTQSKGGVYDFGTASGATDRALGLVLTSSNSPEFGLTLENDTGVTLTQLNISFTDEQWTEYEKPQELDFYYGTNLTALPLSSSTAGLADDSNLSWVTPSGNVAGSVTQMDGTSPANQHDVSGSISGLNWTSGSSLVLMWREATSGKSAAMAIDNFIFSADAAPPTVTNNGLTVSQGATATITTSQLSTSASPGSIPNSQITYTVNSTPASGTLENDGTPLTTGSTFTQADIAAGNVTYTQNGSAATSDSFTFTVSDGVQTATAQTFIVTNPAGDQPPANIVPGAQSAIKSTLLVYSAANGNAISIADPAVGSASIQVALSVSQGVLTLGSTTGVTVTAGSNGSGSLTLQGSVANVNNALIGLTYVPTTGYTGTDALQIVTDDLGNTSAGSPQTASSSVPITVVPPPLLNEIEANPPGTQDNRYEYVELQGARLESDECVSCRL